MFDARPTSHRPLPSNDSRATHARGRGPATKRGASLFALAALAAMPLAGTGGCGGGDDATAAAAANGVSPGGAGAPTPAGPGNDKTPAADPCQPFDFLFPLRKGIPYLTGADATHVYFSYASGGHHRVSTAGGEPTPITLPPRYRGPWAYMGGLLSLSDATAGMPSAFQITSPEPGATPLTIFSLTDLNVRSLDLDKFTLEGDQIFAVGKESLGMPGAADDQWAIYQFDLTARTRATLAKGALDVSSKVARSGNTFFYSAKAKSVHPGELHAVDLLTGEVRDLLPTMLADPIVADDTYLYVVAADRPEDEPGRYTLPPKEAVYRMPVAGGALEKVIDGSAIVARQVASTAEGHVMVLNNGGDVQVWYVSRAGGPPVKIACATYRKSGIHGLAAFGKTAYLSVLIDGKPDDTGSIARVALP